jgi:methionine synthase II (cobalamin-independent)
VSIVKQRVGATLQYTDRSRLILNPDCGFVPGSDNPISLDEAYTSSCVP